MPETLDLNKVVEDIVASYEAKIENINSFFETTHLIFGEFQEPLLEAKQERGEINSQLEDLLAKNEHLRRTDFHRMMQGILAIQVNKEKEIRNLLNSYLTEQKQMVNLLRDNLTRIKAALASGQGVEIKESKELIGQILIQQDKRKQEVSLKLKEFQKEQKEMTQRLQELLVKGKELRIRDLKLMLKEFDVQHKERLARQEERKIEAQKRRGEVRGMLVEFKKKRKDSVKSWRTNSVKVTPPVRNVKETHRDGRVSNPSASLRISPEQSRRANGVNID
jgi:hypothetical protein